MSASKPRSKNRPKTTAAREPTHQVKCSKCNKVIPAKDEALFVEEEVGRFFCGEPCIVTYFTPDIEKLEREYGRNVSPHDLTSAERAQFAHLKWMALEKPDEVWVEKTPEGDHRYCMIGECRPEDKAEKSSPKDSAEQKNIFSIAVCLMLREEPSFLYLAFITSDRFLVDHFRKGDKLKVIRKTESSSLERKGNRKGDRKSEANVSVDHHEQAGHLAEPWTEADSVQVTLIKNRKPSDISTEDFGFYQNCLEETLQEPSELWSYYPKSAKRVYHFIRHYTHDQDYWYVVIAKDTPDESQIEIIEAFPTKDSKLVELCRHGQKENLEKGVGLPEESTLKRNVH